MILKAIGSWMAVLMTVGLFFSTALISTTEALIFACFLVFFAFERSVRSSFLQIIKSPVVLCGLLLFVFIALRGITSDVDNPWDYIGKYRELILLPMVFLFVDNLRWKRRIYYTFLTVMGLVIAHSWLQYFELLEQLKFEPNVSLAGRVAGAIMLAFGCFAYFEEFLRFKKKNALMLAIGFFVLFVCGSIALLLFFNGRTGIAIYFCLGLLYGWRFLGIKGVIIVFGAIVFCVTSAIYFIPDAHERYLFTVSQVSSLGQVDFSQFPQTRSDFYSKALYMLPDVLPFGGGAGSFGVDAMEAHAPLNVHFPNPHNEYLLMLYENGLIGFMLLCLVFGFSWKSSSRENEPEKWLIRALVLTMVVGCCFNSLILDLKEAHFYVLMLCSFVGVAELKKANVDP